MPEEERSRKIRVTLFKSTGKWAYEFDAYVRPSLHLWHTTELFADIEATQQEVRESTIFEGYFVVLDGLDEGHFLGRLYTPEHMREIQHASKRA